MNLPSRLANARKARLARQQQANEPGEYLWRLQAGDARAWEQFVAEWSPRLYSYLHAILRRSDEAQLVLSATMVAVVHAIRSFDGGTTLSTFVYAIAYRQVTHYWRLHTRTEPPMRPNPAGSSYLRAEVDEALFALPEQGQQVLLLRYYVGLSVAEIAQVLGHSYQATEALLNHVCRQFKTEFQRGANA